MQKEQEQKESMTEIKTPLELKMELLQLLKAGETVAQAMRRFGGKSGSKGTTGGTRGKPIAAVPLADRKKIERLTEISDQLLVQDRHLSGIYDMTFEAIEASTVSWEYKDQVTRTCQFNQKQSQLHPNFVEWLGARSLFLHGDI
jgi:hypothetical protein